MIMAKMKITDKLKFGAKVVESVGLLFFLIVFVLLVLRAIVWSFVAVPAMIGG